MKRVGLWFALLVTLAVTLGTTPAAYAYSLEGSVYLLPIGSNASFTSYGSVRFLDDLNQLTNDPLSGTHSVSGPQTFTHAVTGAGQYFYGLEGPVQAGQCYGTSLTASADPEGWRGPYNGSWTGATKCADPPPPDDPPPGGGGTEDENHSSMEPLILDLNGDGIWTTSLTDAPVWFDLDGNGLQDLIAWTAPGHEEGFLYADWNRNRTIDGGQELFGDAAVLPDGTRARHGYEALAAYDLPLYGGNGDRAISHADRIWAMLRLWVDRNHDALASNDENHTLAETGVVEISLQYTLIGPEQSYGIDANGNLHPLQGHYVKRVGGQVQRQAIHEVYFRAALH